MPTFQPKFATSKPDRVDPHITAGVGEGACSTPHDTALIQTMLKGVPQKYYSGRIDGKVGPKTLAAIRAFQANHVKVQSNDDRPGVFDPRGMGVRTLARMYVKHIVVMEGLATPYLVPVGRDAKVRGWIAQLDWTEPVFRKDLEVFALALTGETAIGLSFRPLPGVPHPSCETAAEAVFSDFTWINQEGWEVRAQGHSLTGFSGAQQLQQALHAFARQFELFFKVAGKTWPLTLAQSPVRWQERVRKSPLLNSVWVENPVDKQELILVDPKTGRVRSLTQNQGPMRLRKGLALGSFRTDPPCGLPKPEAYRGATYPLFVEFPGGRTLPYHVNREKLFIQSPTSLLISREQAEALGMLKKDDTDLAQYFLSRTDDGTLTDKAWRAFLWPTVERVTEAAIGFEKLLSNGARDAVSALYAKIKALAKQVARAELDPRNLPSTGLFDLRILTADGRTELLAFLELIYDHGVPGELIHVDTPSNGVLTLMILQKGAFRAPPALTDSPILGGAPVALSYRQPQPITALSLWANDIQRTYRPGPRDSYDILLQAFDVMGVILVNTVFGLWANVPLLFLGASAHSDNILEITASVLSDLAIGKIAKGAVGRMMPPGTVRTAGQQAGLPAERVSVIAQLATSAMEAEIEIFFERVEVAMQGSVGPK